MKTLVAASFGLNSGVAYGQAPTPLLTSPAACPATTQVESTAIARAWHDDVINRRNPTKLSERGRGRGHDGRLPHRLS